MSGIAGIIRFDGGPAEIERVRGMTATMARRGPDGIEHWSGGSVALGHLMLHTTPESLSERQPLLSADGERVLVVHGRVDNRDELAEALSHKRVLPLDNSDAALFLAAYEAWGDDFPDRIEGDFALVIWDARRQAAICARDRVGAKPFVYHWDGSRFSFASEVRPIVDLPWVEQVLDEATVAEFLVNDFRSFEGTFWRGVRRLPLAKRMIVDAAGPRREFYWRLDLRRRIRYRREDEYVEHYRSLLSDVVRRMSRSHRPVAFEVSGGLDSSALFAVADGLERQGRLPAPGIAGYTLGFDEDSGANELVYARAVGAHLGREVREIEPTLKPLDWYLAQTQQSGDFPGYPNGVMSFGLSSAAVADGCRVLMRGQGGDEVVGGSVHRYADALWHGHLHGVAADLWVNLRSRGARALARDLAFEAYSLLPAGFRRKVRALRNPSERTDSLRLSPRLAAALAGLPADHELPISGKRFENQRRILRGIFVPVTIAAYEESERYPVPAIDRRDVFFNRTLIEFSAALPEHLLLRGDGLERPLHRKALRGHLPALVLERRTKAEFSSVFWPALDDLRASILKQSGRLGGVWVDEGRLLSLVQCAQGRPLTTMPLWQLWCLVVLSPLLPSSDKAMAPSAESCVSRLSPPPPRRISARTGGRN